MKEMKLPNLYLDKEVEEYTNKEMAKIKADKEFYDIIKSLGDENKVLTNKIVRDNIAKLSEYHEDYLICKNCPGYSNCPKSNLHTKISYDFDGRFLNKHIDLCEKEVEKINYDSCFYYQDFPLEYEDASTSDITKDKDRKLALKSYIEMEENKLSLLYLKGDIGVGKSFLASVFVNTYIKKHPNTKVAYISCSDRFKELSDKDHSYNKEDKEYFKKVIDILSSVPLLVLDGFGNELKSIFVRDAIIYPILANRKKERLLTIITSNYDIDTIGEMYSFNAKKIHPSAKMIVDILKYLSNNKEIEINTVQALFK